MSITDPKTVVTWITGASSGIGEEVARRLVRRGETVVASARSEDKLTAMAESLGEERGRLVPIPLDVTDPAAVRACADRIAAEIGPIDRVILNAGTYKADNGRDFALDNFKLHYDLNVFGIAHGVDAVLPAMRERRKGHIVVVASVAGYRGLPQSISYSSSKAAAIAMAESLKIELEPFNIKVQVVNPGFVKTPLTDKNDFAMPMLMEVDDAARAFIRGMDEDRFEITFPKPFTFMMNRLRGLPDCVYFAMMRRVRR